MKKTIPTADNWKPCPQGALPRYAQRARSRQRRVVLNRIAGGAALVLLFVCMGTLDLRPSRLDEHSGRLTCAVVQANATGYLAGQLDARLAEQIRMHLVECAECQRGLRAVSAGSPGQIDPRSLSHSMSRCHSPACQGRQLICTSDSHRADNLGQLLALSR